MADSYWADQVISCCYEIERFITAILDSILSYFNAVPIFTCCFLIYFKINPWTM